jgi:hypothetical protein
MNAKSTNHSKYSESQGKPQKNLSLLGDWLLKPLIKNRFMGRAEIIHSKTANHALTYFLGETKKYRSGTGIIDTTVNIKFHGKD